MHIQALESNISGEVQRARGYFSYNSSKLKPREGKKSQEIRVAEKRIPLQRGHLAGLLSRKNIHEEGRGRPEKKWRNKEGEIKIKVKTETRNASAEEDPLSFFGPRSLEMD